MSELSGKIYEFSGFRLIPAEHLLLREDGSVVPLMPKSFKVLQRLVEKHGHLVEKEDLIKFVWADTFVEEANLARVVWTIRRALGENSHHPKFIETVPKFGYRFIAPVTEKPELETTVEIRRSSAARANAESQRETLSAENSPPLPPPQIRLRRAAFALVLFIGAIALGLYFFLSGK